MTDRKPDSSDVHSASASQAAGKQASGKQASGKPAPLKGGLETLDPAKIENAEQRRQRLAAQLRANLTKRKAQARARAQPDVAQSEVAQSEAGGDT